jgi:hypothetical protein
MESLLNAKIDPTYKVIHVARHRTEEIEQECSYSIALPCSNSGTSRRLFLIPNEYIGNFQIKYPTIQLFDSYRRDTDIIVVEPNALFCIFDPNNKDIFFDSAEKIVGEISVVILSNSGNRLSCVIYFNFDLETAYKRFTLLPNNVLTKVRLCIHYYELQNLLEVSQTKI